MTMEREKVNAITREMTTPNIWRKAANRISERGFPKRHLLEPWKSKARPDLEPLDQNQQGSISQREEAKRTHKGNKEGHKGLERQETKGGKKQQTNGKEKSLGHRRSP
ncbi:unnamed protein product [Linum trigynum]|uniref:Uncharacterized protein n=1 Tax=Linum trigynum TaxID=586398 RepID=A0AAV2DNB0_9ROSI